MAIKHQTEEDIAIIKDQRSFRLDKTETKSEKSLMAQFDRDRSKYQKLKNMPRAYYETGIPAFDAYIGNDIPDENDPSILHINRGLRDGVHFTIGGKTHLGKSVFAMNVAGKIVRPFIQKGLPSWIEYFTPEEGLEEVWMQTCAGLGADAVAKGFIKVTHRGNKDTSTEGLLSLVSNIHKMKMASPETFLYDTTDERGNPIKKNVPTVLIVDSWTNLVPEELLSATDFSPTFYLRKNGVNGVAMNKLRVLQLEANIMFFAIVHVGTKNEIGNSHASRDYAALAATMSVSGGKQFHFETEVGIVLQKFLLKDKAKVEDALKIKIDGTTKAIEAVIYKSRFGQHDASTTFALVYDKSVGFDSLKSLLLDAYHYRNIFKNAGSYHYLVSNPEVKFYKKDVLNMLTTDADFRKRFGEDYQRAFKDYTEYRENIKEVLATDALLDSLF